MKYFTHYWLKNTWEKNRLFNVVGAPLDHLSGSKFRERGIDSGDVGYVVNIFRGQLYLCGKMVVGKICDVDEAARVTGLPKDQLYDAPEHVIASEATPMEWDRIVPSAIVKRLTFDSPKRPKLLFDSNGRLNGQTVRPVRLLTPTSAELLDQVIGAIPAPVPKFHENYSTFWEAGDDLDATDIGHEYESGVEGNKTKRFVTHYERRPEYRAEAIRVHKLDCKGCGLNFQREYGDHGAGFIHVHHLVPVSKYEGPKKINVATDMTVLCPNCHAMVHKKRSETLSLEQLRKLIDDARSQGASTSRE